MPGNRKSRGEMLFDTDKPPQPDVNASSNNNEQKISVRIFACNLTEYGV
jgi:hypothetical protein